MGAPRIVIHIGAPKTGSTSVQRLVRADPDLWRRHGIYHPVLPEVEQQGGNAMLLGAALGAPTPGIGRSFPEIDVAGLEPGKIASRLLSDWQPDQEVLLLSTVTVEAAQALPLRRVLPDDVEYTVVLVVRNQYRWIESYYRQLVKTMLFDAGIADLVTEVLDETGPRYCPDWLLHYEAWRDAFGSCRVVLFEDAVADLARAFAAAAGLRLPPGIEQLPAQNVSPDAFQIAYLLALQRPVELSDFRRRRRAAGVASRRCEAPSLRYLETDDRERLRSRFAPGNRRMLEILGRPYEGSPLDLSDAAAEHVRLNDVYRSRRYRSYRKLADSIYAASA